MIESIIIKNSQVYKNNTINLAKYNLFIGKNGCGKSTLAKVCSGILTQPYSDDIIIKSDGKEHLVVENRNFGKYVSEFRINPMFSNQNLQTRTNMDDVDNPLASFWPDQDFLTIMNKWLPKLFNVKVKIERNNGTYSFVYSQNGVLFDPQNAGYGIINILKISEIIYRTNDLTCFIEEPSLALHSSQCTKFLDMLKQDLMSDSNQVVFISQDIAFILEYVKLFKNDEEFKIFKFEKLDSKISITDVQKDGLEAILSDTAEEFPTKEDIELLQKIYFK